jgi:hypothetical protein
MIKEPTSKNKACQINWDREEVVLLVGEYFRTKGSRIEQNRSI